MCTQSCLLFSLSHLRLSECDLAPAVQERTSSEHRLDSQSADFRPSGSHTLFLSPVLHQLAVVVDAISMDWLNQILYAFPPYGIFPQVVLKLAKIQNALLLLLAPVWTTKDWFVPIRARSIYPPYKLPTPWYMFRQPRCKGFTGHHSP